MRDPGTKEFFTSLTRVTLEAKDYTVEFNKDGYIIAHPNSEEQNDLIIYPVYRCLSDKQKKETTIIGANETAVFKLEKRAAAMAGDYIPCIAFGIGKYNYFDSEICIIPTNIWAKRAERGSVYSLSSGKYYYNYAKSDDELPEGAILRAQWRGNIL